MGRMSEKVAGNAGSRCPKPSEQTLVAQMYAMAWDNFRARPEVAFRRMGAAIREFYVAFPRTIWGGYGQEVKEPAWFSHRVLVLLILVGLGMVATRRANAIELSFWALFCASIAASAAIIYYDDGARTLAASHPMVALLFATGFATRTLKQPSAVYEARLIRCGALGLLLAALLMATIPWASHRVSPRPCRGRWHHLATNKQHPRLRRQTNVRFPRHRRWRTVPHRHPQHSFVGFQRNCRKDRRRGNLAGAASSGHADAAVRIRLRAANRNRAPPPTRSTSSRPRSWSGATCPHGVSK